MPELPDITVYIEALQPRLVGHTLNKIRIANPFVVRSVDPPVQAAEGRRVLALRRIGKRIGIGLEQDLWILIHLMVAGRFRWLERGARIPGRMGLAALDADSGSLILTEAGTTRRASLTMIQGEQDLAGLDRGGLEVLEATVGEFGSRLRSENHTLKRALTDPRLFSGIGNAYSDEILHRARLSPVRHTGRLGDEEIARLHESTRHVLSEWIDRLRAETGAGFPAKVTAFRAGMAVHGKFGQPCPDCGSPVQRIRYASNETNYCARCQTGGKLLADRALSRLLKQDWPRSLDELDLG